VRLFVAIPAYDRRITCETARSLLNEQGAAALAGHEMQISFVPGCSLITHARNQAVSDFLSSDADRLIFIDSDIAWEPGAVVQLASHERDFVGGAYRYKDATEGYPVGWLDATGTQPLIAQNGLLAVAALPGGFLSLSRDVFSRLTEAFPERSYVFHGRKFQAFFHCPPGAGEDGAFCNDWRAIGGDVWMDPELSIDHVEGSMKYQGHIGKWLRSRMEATNA
jgi:hypothetical protein